MRDNYYTVKEYGTDEIIIQKSRFIAYVSRVQTEEEANEFIDSIKKKHYDATHNCSAYVVGPKQRFQKANDDGEPSGTAGVPILEVLLKQNLEDTAVVITRYFGGIKLGSGGLIRAYGQSTTVGIEAAGVVLRKQFHLMTVNIDYTWLGKIENEVRQSKYDLKEIVYLDDVQLQIYVDPQDEQEFTEWITNMTSGQAEIEIAETLFLEIPRT